jgi:superfamily I DNA/RNA helicase
MHDEKQKAEELQRAVVNHPGACYVQACPGAGKTQTLVRRVIRQLEELSPRQGIAVLSFTNSAIDEFTDRFATESRSKALEFPHFVGTFDAFLNHFIVKPMGLPGCSTRPTIVDAWDGLEIRHHQRKAKGAPIALKRFDGDGRLTANALKTLSPNQIALRDNYEANAKNTLDGLRKKGKIDIVGARRVVRERLKDESRANALGEALAARFAEIIVDEAQDCNDDDVAILQWLQQHGTRLVLVCDPDQAIYGFRKGSATAFADFAATFTQLHLLGNFRSSKIVCQAAATMRSRKDPDLAVGDDKDASHKITLLTFKGSVDSKAAVAQIFHKLVRDAGLDLERAVVLAHKRLLAERVSANRPQADGNVGRLKTLATCVAGYCAQGANERQRERSILAMIRLIMEIEGVDEYDRASMRLLREDEQARREYYRRAVEVLEALPASCVDSVAEQSWKKTAEDMLSAAVGKRVSLRNGEKWAEELKPRNVGGIGYATIHEAKGKAYDAVCLAIEAGKGNEDLLNEWEQRASATSESLRVLYVGLTRARKMAVLAVEERIYSRVRAILTSAGLDVAETSVAAPKRSSRASREPKNV